MTFLAKLNKAVDFIAKLVFVIIAFSLALLPIPFILGHEQLHQQPWAESFQQYSARILDIEQAKGLQFSNIALRSSGTVKPQTIRATLELGDFVCYTLQNLGGAVVRRNIEPKIRKSKKGTSESGLMDGYEVHTILSQNPPLAGLKDTVAQFIDFESEALLNKYWVVVIAGEPDASLIKQIAEISENNPGYKFILVSPTPVKNKTFKSAKPTLPAIESQPESTVQTTSDEKTESEEPATEEEAEESNEEANPLKDDKKEEDDGKKENKKAKKEKKPKEGKNQKDKKVKVKQVKSEQL